MAIMPKYIFADDFRDLEEYFLSCSSGRFF